MVEVWTVEVWIEAGVGVPATAVVAVEPAVGPAGVVVDATEVGVDAVAAVVGPVASCAALEHADRPSAAVVSSIAARLPRPRRP